MVCRVDELFEARHPKDACTLAPVEGKFVDTGDIVRDKRVIEIIPEGSDGDETKAQVNIPVSRQLLVQDGEVVVKGEPLDEGVLDAHEILAVMGENALQEYLIREIQAIYRGQGVTINDKHIEIILRQMLRKVEIIDAGDTTFVPMTTVDRILLKKTVRL